MKIESLYKLYNSVFDGLDRWLSPLWFFYIRYWLAEVFFKSGLVSISDWENNINLFKYEFNVPLISPELAAYLSTAVELICPVLLILGLGTRFAALAIFFTALSIELTYIHHLDHILWMLASSLLILKGGEKISIDYLLSKTWFKDLNKKG
ncbi:MAG: DoxX family membrane protein [Proteobacteria bacterium]|nr:DoxX family membrane protein [Pseudomonadota bacterium]